MAPNEILDTVLKFIYIGNGMQFEVNQVAFNLEDIREKLNREQLYVFMENEDSQVLLSDSVDMKEMLEKLGKDGYLKHMQYGQMPDLFHTTFEGRWFIQQGGYTKKLKREKSTSTFQTISTVLVGFGALVAAIYYLHELLKHYWNFVFSIKALTAFFLILSCNLALLIMWLIMQEISQRRKRD